MQRCIQIAKNGLGQTRPNPMVGCVIVYEGSIIAEGFTSPYGGSHAEVNAITSVKNKALLEKSTLYVTLEPCAHYGKTPPCANLIIAHKIPRVVIGTIDPFSKVAGKGIQLLKEAGCEVTVGVLEEACREHHKRFLTFHGKKRPFIVLKWAVSQDGFIDVLREETEIEDAKPNWITNRYARQYVHKLRAEEQGILIGTNTVINDNPALNVRNWSGQDPVRIILDKTLRIPVNYTVLNDAVKTLVFTEVKRMDTENTKYIKIDFSRNIVRAICEELYRENIQSVLIEGGKQTLQSFIDANVWDEALVFVGACNFKKGLQAPRIHGALVEEINFGDDVLKKYKNPC
ncbi:MAG: bifunctional diaminohydroxyphosphoribosylaminopyrimidine deaminase/5-amino-6-(5-phosphoribosylamino)uracil reductase RibD [Flavobacteriaceae bacterium]|nr:bifunctional diaminohydroxyphosphoribosylaminopyrimidine deaminase/5-amino-6-(5-phosphoribosylamino)uracil reductase RibD [Flavobacteriaceae bacterium]